MSIENTNKAMEDFSTELHTPIDKIEESPDEKLQYPINSLPQKLIAPALNISKVMDAPIEFIASGIIAGAAILLNKKGKIIIKEDWIESAILWTMIVAEPGIQLKSPVFKIIKSIINELDNVLDQKYEAKCQEYEFKSLVYEKEKNDFKKGKGNSNPPERPNEPNRELIYTSDTTVECLIEIQKKNSQGVAIINDEISHFFRSLDQYKTGGNDKQYYLAAWSGDQHIKTRKSDLKPISTRPYHNIYGNIQPSEVEKLLFKGLTVTDGFVERWLFVLSDHKRHGKVVREEIDENFKIYLKEIFQNLYTMKETCYCLTEQGKKIYDNYCYELYKVQMEKSTPGLMASYLEKQKVYVARLALILHCMNNPNEKYIQPETFLKAVDLSLFYIKCFKRISKLSIKMKSNERIEYILEWMKTRERTEVTARELHLSNSSKFKTSKDALPVFEQMVIMGLGIVVDNARTTKFTLLDSTMLGKPLSPGVKPLDELL